jgi:hypothetical protein
LRCISQLMAWGNPALVVQRAVPEARTSGLDRVCPAHLARAPRCAHAQSRSEARPSVARRQSGKAPDSLGLLLPSYGPLKDTGWRRDSWRTGGVFDVLRAQFFPSIFRPPVFDPRKQDLSVEFFHGAASCVARLVICKPPICVRGACHHSAPPKARVDQGQSGTSQNRSRRWQAVGLSGQAPSIAPAIADTCAKGPVGAQFA